VYRLWPTIRGHGEACKAYVILKERTIALRPLDLRGIDNWEADYSHKRYGGAREISSRPAEVEIMKLVKK